MRQAKQNYSSFNSINLCQEMTRLNKIPQSLVDRALEILNDPDSTNRPFDARGLATLIYNLAKQKYTIDCAFIDIWQDAAIENIKSFNPQDLSNSIYAFGILGIKPSQQFINTWQAAAIENIKSFNSQQLANSIYAFGILGIKPSQQFINTWQTAAIGNIKSFNSQELANSIYALMLIQKVGKVDFIQDNYIKLFIEKLKQSNEISPEEKHILNTSSLVYCNEQPAFDAPKTNNSVLQNRVYSCLKRTYLDAEKEKYFSRIGASVDIYIEINGKKVVVQVDGPSHFLHNSQDETPATKFNTYLLEEHCGAKVVRASYKECDSKTDEQLSKYLKLQIDNALVSKAKPAMPTNLVAPSISLSATSSTFIPTCTSVPPTVTMKATAAEFIPMARGAGAEYRGRYN